MSTLYLECQSGISGDMTAAALIDLGADQEVLHRALNSLNVDGFEIRISRVKKSGIDACDFHVILDAEHENHDHDMEYLYGEHHPHSHETEVHTHHHGEHGHHEHTAETETGHHHDHGHGHAHAHRGLLEILHIISHADMTESAKRTAEKIFTVLGNAEAKAHGMPVSEVHFHEVGAVDSIADIVAAAVCLDNLGITEVIVPKLYEGQGTIRCQHGLMPVPVPAVANIVQEHQIMLQQTQTEGELVTPTGAAIVAAVRTRSQLPKQYMVRKIGIGAGKREYDRPGILRAMLIEEPVKTEEESIWKLESTIDDCSGEVLGYVMDRLFHAGARDVHYTPVFMKKNRPAYQLNVICSEDVIPKLEQIIFMETTTIGIRRFQVERTVLQRKTEEFNTSLGKAEVKICSLENGVRIYPEYESVAEISREQNLPYLEVWNQILKEVTERVSE